MASSLYDEKISQVSHDINDRSDSDTEKGGHPSLPRREAAAQAAALSCAISCAISCEFAVQLALNQLCDQL